MAGEIEMDVSIKPTMDNAAFRAINKRMEQLGASVGSIQSGAHLRKGAAVATWAYGALRAGAFQNPTQAATALRTAAGGNLSSAGNLLIRQNTILAAQKLIADEQKILAQRIKNAVHFDEGLEYDLAKHMQKRVAFGLAPTYDAARMMFQDTAGVKFTTQERAWIRDTGKFAAGMAKEQSREERVEAARIRLGALQNEYKQARARNLVRLYQGQAADPLAHQEAQKLSGEITKTIKVIAKNTGNTDKTLTTFKKQSQGLVRDTAPQTPQAQPTTLATLGKLGLRALGVGSLAALGVTVAKWVWQQGKASEARGASAFDRAIKYGYSERALGLAEMTAVQYGVNPAAVQNAQNYGADFRQRMLYGEVSDREWIAASQMGEYGRLLMAGVGEYDPGRLQRALEAQIRAAGDDPRKLAQLRQRLTWLGQDTDLIKIRTHTPSEEEYLRNLSLYTYSVGEDIQRAREKASQIRGTDPLKRSIGGDIAGWRRAFLGQESAERRIEEMRARGLSDEEIWARDRETVNIAKYGFWRGRLQTNFADKEAWSFKPNPSPVVRELMGQGAPAVGSQVFYINQNINTSDPTRAAEESAAFIQKDAAELTQAASRFNRNIGRAN